MTNFVAALKILPEHCKLGKELEDMLRSRVVCSINSMAIKTIQLEQLKLIFEDAIQTAMAMEIAKRDAGEICEANSSISAFATH